MLGSRDRPRERATVGIDQSGPFVSHRAAATATAVKRLTGDLNTPRRELPDGEIWSFARTAGGSLRTDRGEPWERSELALLRGLEPHGLRDLFRDLHPYEHEEISFAARAGRVGWRLDHMVGSEHFDPVGCGYDHTAREAGLSDHSPMWAELQMRQHPAGGD